MLHTVFVIVFQLLLDANAHFANTPYRDLLFPINLVICPVILTICCCAINFSDRIMVDYSVEGLRKDNW